MSSTWDLCSESICILQISENRIHKETYILLNKLYIAILNFLLAAVNLVTSGIITCSSYMCIVGFPDFLSENNVLLVFPYMRNRISSGHAEHNRLSCILCTKLWLCPSSNSTYSPSMYLVNHLDHNFSNCLQTVPSQKNHKISLIHDCPSKIIQKKPPIYPGYLCTHVLTTRPIWHHLLPIFLALHQMNTY